MENAEQRYESRLYSMLLKLLLYSCLRLECNALHGAMGAMDITVTDDHEWIVSRWMNYHLPNL